MTEYFYILHDNFIPVNTRSFEVQTVQDVSNLNRESVILNYGSGTGWPLFTDPAGTESDLDAFLAIEINKLSIRK